MPRALAIATLLALAGCTAARRPAHPSPLVGRPVAVKVADLGGQLRDVSEDRGKVRIVDFWATWCEPCKEQLPFLARLGAARAARGLSVYAVACDEERADVEQFLAEMPLPFTILWDKGGAMAAESLGVTRLPTTLLVDRRGIVREVHLGFEKRDERELEAAVDRLLAE